MQREGETLHQFQQLRADLTPGTEGQDHHVRPYIFEELQECHIAM